MQNSISGRRAIIECLDHMIPVSPSMDIKINVPLNLENFLRLYLYSYKCLAETLEFYYLRCFWFNYTFIREYL